MKIKIKIIYLTKGVRCLQSVSRRQIARKARGPGTLEIYRRAVMSASLLRSQKHKIKTKADKDYLHSLRLRLEALESLHLSLQRLKTLMIDEDDPLYNLVTGATTSSRQKSMVKLLDCELDNITEV